MVIASSPWTPNSIRPKLDGHNQETIQRCWPDNVIADILARLPVKPIFRFKSVCKSWCLLIRSRFFIDLHRTHPHKDRHQNQLFFSRLGKHGVDVFSKDFSSSCRLSESAPLFDVGVLREALTGLTLDEIYRELSHVTFITNPHGVKKALEPDMKVLGPLSNGICCVIAEIRASVPIISTSGFCNPAICNPATRELKLISPPKCRLFPTHKQYYGFCSIQASDGVVFDYKIVVIHQHELGAAVFGYEKFKVFVYSLRRDTWTEYIWRERGYNEHLRDSCKALAAFIHKNKVESPRITQDLEFLPQAFVNGSCHWMAEGSVLQLDMTKEVFGSFAGPPMDYANLPDYPRMRRGVFAFDDHLFAIFVICGPVSGVCDDHEIDVWMMMEYGVATSWTKTHSSKFQFEGVLEKFLGMFYSKESHGIERMFFQDKAGVFMSYDCSTATITTMEKDGTCDSSLICWKTIGILEYRETLEPVSLEDNVEDTILSV